MVSQAVYRENPPKAEAVNDDLVKLNDTALNALNAIAYLVSDKPQYMLLRSSETRHNDELDRDEKHFTGSYVSAYMVRQAAREMAAFLQAVEGMERNGKSS